MRDAAKSGDELLAEIGKLRERVEELQLALSQADAVSDELRREREQLLSVFESINEVIYIADPTTHEVIFVNKAAKAQLGKDPTGGMCYREFQGLDMPCEFCTNPILLAEPDKPYYWEHHNRMLNRDYLIVDRLIHWPDGRDVRFEMAIDVTESRRARRRRESLNLLLTSLGSDLLDNMERLVKGARDIIGCSYAAFCLLVRDRLSMLSSVGGEEGFLVTGEKESYLSYRYICSGSREPLLISDFHERPEALADPVVCGQDYRSGLLYPVLVKGEVKGCLTLFDREPRAWTREEMELTGTVAHVLAVENERLKREEDLKDFVDVASHELRHPVTIIKGYAASLRQHWKKLDEQQREELIAAIERGSERLARMASELLDISLIERGRIKLDRGMTELGKILKVAVEEMRDRGFSNPFLLSLPDEEILLVADDERLREVMIILLENAVAYSPQGAVIELEAEAGEDAVRIAVLDRGIGIRDEDRERVFERFYQVEDALHHSTPGMGMGLYIAREIVEKHGGRIWNEPRPGGGTAFHVVLPVKREGSGDAPKGSPTFTDT